MKIIMIIMAMITITIVVDMKILTMVMNFQVGAREGTVRSKGCCSIQRSQGAAPPRGRAGYSQRGGSGSARGVRGLREGAQQQRGRGVRGRGWRGGNVGGSAKLMGTTSQFQAAPDQ